ncbi:MAG TPA: cytochrome c peroxidase [Steroidobacteraceae bacterium]|jgi:cytochrome c peroxidase
MFESGRRLLLLMLAGSLVAAAFAGDIDAGAARPDLALSDFKRPAKIPTPRSNPSTPEKVALGQMLFFDPRLSGSGVISCASCHNPALGWSDALPKGLGHMGGRLGRHTPTILNVAYGEPYFWDGRAATLEDQAKGPLTSAKEMDMPADLAVARVVSIPGYVAAFDRAFPGQPVSIDSIAAAIATYERTVVSNSAPFDRWVAGDENAIPGSAKRGFALFNGKANCAVCHAGWRMTDDGFHDIGMNDPDRGRAAVAPGIVQLEYAFKTPTLRNINQRAPYMHDGSLPTLAAVIDHYDQGFVNRPSLDPQMHSLGLSTEEKSDLIAFLNTLTSVDTPAVVPVLPQ